MVNSEAISLLKALKTAAPVDLSTNGICIQAVTLDTEVKIPEGASIMRNTLYIRDFYDRLFNMIRTPYWWETLGFLNRGTSGTCCTA